MKKAQIRMSETIAVMFIFFVLILFGIVFYYNYSKAAFEAKEGELLIKKATEITLKTIYLPELICSRGKAEPEDNCFDVMKLRQAAEEDGVFFTRLTDYYYDLFPYTKINITRLYPEYEEWILYDKPKIKKIIDEETGEEREVPGWEKKEATYFVVALKDETKEEGVYSLGILTVEVYS